MAHSAVVSAFGKSATASKPQSATRGYSIFAVAAATATTAVQLMHRNRLMMHG